MQDKESLLHLAVVVGYIRVTLKADAVRGGGGVSLREIRDHAFAHLARPEFADVRGRAESEIFEFIKDGLLNGADGKIAAAKTGDFAMFWKFADGALGREAPPVSIDPLLIA